MTCSGTSTSAEEPQSFGQKESKLTEAREEALASRAELGSVGGLVARVDGQRTLMEPRFQEIQNFVLRKLGLVEARVEAAASQIYESCVQSLAALVDGQRTFMEPGRRSCRIVQE